MPNLLRNLDAETLALAIETYREDMAQVEALPTGYWDHPEQWAQVEAGVNTATESRANLFAAVAEYRTRFPRLDT